MFAMTKCDNKVFDTLTNSSLPQVEKDINNFFNGQRLQERRFYHPSNMRAFGCRVIKIIKCLSTGFVFYRVLSSVAHVNTMNKSDAYCTLAAIAFTVMDFFLNSKSLSAKKVGDTSFYLKELKRAYSSKKYVKMRTYLDALILQEKIAKKEFYQVVDKDQFPKMSHLIEGISYLYEAEDLVSRKPKELTNRDHFFTKWFITEQKKVKKISEPEISYATAKARKHLWSGGIEMDDPGFNEIDDKYIAILSTKEATPDEVSTT